jgi:hypothetical protein
VIQDLELLVFLAELVHVLMDGLMELIVVHHNPVVDSDQQKHVVDIRVEEVEPLQRQHQVVVEVEVVQVTTVQVKAVELVHVLPDRTKTMVDGDVTVMMEV